MSGGGGVTSCTKSVKHDKSNLSMIPYYLSFFINDAWTSSLIFHIPEHIPRGKKNGNLKKYHFGSNHT